MTKIYDHSVIYDGELYKAGEPVPVVENSVETVENTESVENSVETVEKPQKKARKAKGGE